MGQLEGGWKRGVVGDGGGWWVGVDGEGGVRSGGVEEEGERGKEEGKGGEGEREG